jgi:hypothetical protein
MVRPNFSNSLIDKSHVLRRQQRLASAYKERVIRIGGECPHSGGRRND